MKFKRLTPILWTEDMQESIRFYTEILGFSCINFNKDWQWATLQKSEIEIMLSKPNAYVKLDKMVFSGSFYFEVDDVETLWHQLKDKVNIVYNLETFDWGMKEFALTDNNGYILQFGENTSN